MLLVLSKRVQNYQLVFSSFYLPKRFTVIIVVVLVVVTGGGGGGGKLGH